MLKTAFHMFSGDPSKQVNKEFRNLTNFMESSVFYQIKSLLKAEGANKFCDRYGMYYVSATLPVY